MSDHRETPPPPHSPGASPDADEPAAPRGDRPVQGDAERAAQEENAETSMDQPSQ